MTNCVDICRVRFACILQIVLSPGRLSVSARCKCRQRQLWLRLCLLALSALAGSLFVVAFVVVVFA